MEETVFTSPRDLDPVCAGCVGGGEVCCCAGEDDRGGACVKNAADRSNGRRRVRHVEDVMTGPYGSLQGNCDRLSFDALHLYGMTLPEVAQFGPLGLDVPGSAAVENVARS